MSSGTEILQEIKKLYRAGEALNYAAMRRKYPRLLWRACQKFKSWNLAIKAANLDPAAIRKLPKWSKKTVCQQLRELYARRAFTDIRTLSKKYPRLYGACCRYFGGGLAALTAAGIDYEKLLNEHPRRWTKSRIIAEIQRREKSGLTLRLTEIYRCEPQFRRFYYATLYQFGKWSNALRAAGISPQSVQNRQRKWPRERVISEIQKRYVAGKLLNTETMLREDLALHTAGRRHFGTWKKAVEQAGIDYDQYVRGGLYGWTKPEILKALRERLLSNSCTRKQVQKESPSLYRATMHYFKTWETALQKAKKR